MEEIARTWFTQKQKIELWERWRSGQCIAAIACLWWFAMRRRNRRPPSPTRPYREWKD